MDISKNIVPTIHGVGVIDMDISSNSIIYETWRRMIRNCYGKRRSKNEHSMTRQWRSLRNFHDFIMENNAKHKTLKPGKHNKIYSHVDCYFVDRKPFSRVKKTPLQPVKRVGCTCSCTCGAASLLE